MPNEPAESNFKTKVTRRLRTRCVERNGIVWTYMGPRETPPPLPEWLPNLEPDCQVWMRLQECNCLQALEGDIDTVHAVFLHSGHLRTEQTLQGSDGYYITPAALCALRRRSDHEIGATYAAVRRAEADTEYWRMGHFLLPFYTMNAPGLLGIKNQSLAWVPLDDQNTMVWTVGRQAPLAARDRDHRRLQGGLRAPRPARQERPVRPAQRATASSRASSRPTAAGWVASGRWPTRTTTT